MYDDIWSVRASERERKKEKKERKKKNYNNKKGGGIVLVSDFQRQMIIDQVTHP